MFRKFFSRKDQHDVANFPGLVHSHTNESLFAICKGLDLSHGHTILAIGSSGDQGFSMLGYGKVYAVDTDPVQVAFMEFQRRNLKNNPLTFLYHGHVGSSDGIKVDGTVVVRPEATRQERNEYFLPRLPALKQYVQDIFIMNRDLWTVAEGTYDRIYCSNAQFPQDIAPSETLERLMMRLPEGGLAYFTEGEAIKETIAGTRPKGLEIQSYLTSMARSSERSIDKYIFSPLVLVKR